VVIKSAACDVDLTRSDWCNGVFLSQTMPPFCSRLDDFNVTVFSLTGTRFRKSGSLLLGQWIFPCPRLSVHSSFLDRHHSDHAMMSFAAGWRGVGQRLE